MTEHTENTAVDKSIDKVATVKRNGAKVIGVFIDSLDIDATTDRIISWSKNKMSRYVCLCNVHSSVTAASDTIFKQTLSQSDMVLPDGMPVAWMLRRKGFPEQRRIAGPDLMLNVCASAEQTGVAVFLYGSTDSTLKMLKKNLCEKYPELIIAGAISPPFRELTETEEKEIQDQINNSGAGILFVAIGCPRQEYWMESQRGKIHAVMLGVGAAFNFHAGDIVRAPLWVQRLGLEWLHRLISEPRRLWKRYAITNTIFLLRATKDLLARH